MDLQNFLDLHPTKIRVPQPFIFWVLPKFYNSGSPLPRSPARKEEATQRARAAQQRWAQGLERWARALSEAQASGTEAFEAWKRRWGHLRQVQRMEPGTWGLDVVVGTGDDE